MIIVVLIVVLRNELYFVAYYLRLTSIFLLLKIISACGASASAPALASWVFRVTCLWVPALSGSSVLKVMAFAFLSYLESF